MDALIIFSFIAAIVIAVVVAVFIIYRRGLRFAKGIERGIKMVPVLISLPPSSEDAEVGGRDVRDVIQERISQAEVLYNLIASTATKGFKSKFFGQRHISFEIVAIDGVIRFYTAVPVALVSVVKQAILTAYPGAQLDEVEDHNVFSETGKLSGTYGGEIVLKQPYSYPIATANELKRDAMQAIIKSLTNLGQGDGASLQILIRPARDGWTKASESLVKKKREEKGSKSSTSAKALLQAPFKAPESSGDKESKSPKQLTSMEQSVLDSIEQKTKSSGYEVMIRLVASSGTASQAQTITNNIVSAFSLFDAPGLNGFKFQPAKNMEKFVTDFIFRFFPPEQNKTILNSVELASLFHFPDDQFTKTTQLQRQASKQIEGPTSLSKDGLVLGHNVYHGVKKEIRLSDEDRRRHVYIVGQTGTGKSTMLENLMIQDMKAGKGFAFVDPHGDTAEKILGMVPQERTEDIIYFDPGDMENPLGLNIFEYHTEDQKDFLIQEAINMLYRLYDPQHTGIIGPRYEHLFRNAALTVMSGPEGGTFVDIPKLFRDPQYVRQKLKYVEDQSVREFWQKEMPQSQRSNDFGEIVSWFVSKFGAFLSNQLMRNTIGQTKSAFDLRELMDSNKILVANLSKGRLGELNSQLLGMIFVMKFQAAAMSRANVPEDQRKDFSLYVDEFQNFSTESFAFILSEARKYRMNLIVANQFISQLSEEVRDAVFGNVGTIMSYRTGPADADFLVKQFAPSFTERDLVNLPNYNAAIRLMSKGLPTQPFNIEALPPLASSNPQLAMAIKKLSAAKHARPRAQVEKEIFDRLSVKTAPSPFESLSNAQASGSAPAAPATSSGAKPGAGDSSFLDEWLNKRRQTLRQQQASKPPTPASTPPVSPQQPSPALADSLSSSSEPAHTPSIQKAPTPPKTHFSPSPSDQESPVADEGGLRVSAQEKRQQSTEESSPDSPSSPVTRSAEEPTAHIEFSPESTESHFSANIQPPAPQPSPVDRLLNAQQSAGSGEVNAAAADEPEPVLPHRETPPPVVVPQPRARAATPPASIASEEAKKEGAESARSPETETTPQAQVTPTEESEPKTAATISKTEDDTSASPDPDSLSAGDTFSPQTKTDDEAAPAAEEKGQDEAGVTLAKEEKIAADDSGLGTDTDAEPKREPQPEESTQSSETPEGQSPEDPAEALGAIGAKLETPKSTSQEDKNHDAPEAEADTEAKGESAPPPSGDEPSISDDSHDDRKESEPKKSAKATIPELPDEIKQLGAVGSMETDNKPAHEKDADTTSPETESDDKAADKSEQADSAPADPAIANLKPGEIYIDDEGNVHQG